MANIYTIYDSVCDTDCFIFIENSDGNAKTYFNNWLSIQSHRSFQLHRIMKFEFNIDQSMYTPISAERELLIDGVDLARGEPPHV